MKCHCEDFTGGETHVSGTCIKDIWLFDNFDESEFDRFKTIGIRREIDRGGPVFMQGDPADEMFLIKAGTVKLAKDMEDGTEIILDFRKSGDLVGENMFSEDTFYPVSAWAMEKTHTCGFNRNRFEQLVLENPDIGLKIIKNISRHLSMLTSRIGDMTTGNLEDRLYNVLVNMAREHGQKESGGYAIRFPLTHEDLSFLIGAHRVSVTKSIKHLERSGKIIRDGRALIIPEECLA